VGVVEVAAVDLELERPDAVRDGDARGAARLHAPAALVDLGPGAPARLEVLDVAGEVAHGVRARGPDGHDDIDLGARGVLDLDLHVEEVGLRLGHRQGVADRHHVGVPSLKRGMGGYSKAPGLPQLYGSSDVDG
jgi:hypothetical protein